MARRPRASCPRWSGPNASGYGAIREMIDGHITPAKAEERIVTETRQYAKRQRTWFRHQLVGEDITLLDSSDTAWMDHARAWWEEGSE